MTNDDTQLAILLARRPRPDVAELCRHTYVLPGSDRVHTYMPWIATVRRLSGDTLVRAMLTQAILHGGQFGCRNIYTVAFWREPQVREVFDKAQLMQLCRKWATAYPYEVLGDYRRLAIALGRYDRPDLDVATSANELAHTGRIDAAKIVTVAARNLGEWLREDHLKLLLSSGLSTATLYQAAMRTNHSANSLILQGYVLARPGLSRQDSAALVARVQQRLDALHEEYPLGVACAYRWLLEGATRAMGSQRYERVPGLVALRTHLMTLGWQFLTAVEEFDGQGMRAHVRARTTRGTIKVWHRQGIRNDVIDGGDEVLVHPAEWGRAGSCYMIHPNRPPHSDDAAIRQNGGIAF